MKKHWFRILLMTAAVMVCLTVSVFAAGAGSASDAAQYIDKDAFQITPKLIADDRGAAAENTRLLQEATDKASAEKGTVVLPAGTFYFASAGKTCAYSGGACWSNSTASTSFSAGTT